MVVVPHAPTLQKQGQVNSVSSRSAGSTYRVPDHEAPYRESLSENELEPHLSAVRCEGAAHIAFVVRKEK